MCNQIVSIACISQGSRNAAEYFLKLNQLTFIHSTSQIQKAFQDIGPFPTYPVCMCLIFLADKKPASLSADFLMRCCNRLSDFTSLPASYPELQGTTVLDVYAACGIGACASILSKQPEPGSALLQDHFTAFISRILPALIQRQHFDAAERVRLSLAVF